MSRITWYLPTSFNTLRLRQNGRHFADDIFKCIFLNENAWISLKISLKFVPRVRINNIPTLVQIMAWRRSGDKPFSESMMVSLPTHICVTRPQWVKAINTCFFFVLALLTHHMVCFLRMICYAIIFVAFGVKVWCVWWCIMTVICHKSSIFTEVCELVTLDSCHSCGEWVLPRVPV